MFLIDDSLTAENKKKGNLELILATFATTAPSVSKNSTT